MATDKPADPPKSAESTGKAPPSSPPPAPAAPQTAAAKTSEGKEPEAKEPEEKVLEPADAKALFMGGHKLKKKGDKEENWIAATRVRGVLCLAMPLTDELQKELLDKELVLLPD